MKAKATMIFVCLGMALLLAAADVAAQQGVVSLDKVSNLFGPGQVRAGENVRFVLRLNNNTTRRVDISNGFRIWSPDGAFWDSTTFDTLGEIIDGESRFHLLFDIAFSTFEASCDGVGMDTVGVLGAGNPTRANRQLPIGYNDTVLAITAWSHDFRSVGKSICIDTCFFQPGGTWKWVRVEGATEYVFYPAFQGLPGQLYTPGTGYCFQVRQGDPVGQGEVSIEQVSTSAGNFSVAAGQPVRMVLRYHNTVGEKVDIANGFRLSSPDGAVWDSTSIDTVINTGTGTSPFAAFFDLYFALLAPNVDGHDADSVGFIAAGISIPNQKLPPGYNDSAIAVTAWFSSKDAVGKHICIDTSFVYPALRWVWVGQSLVEYYPTFSGLAGQPYNNGNPGSRSGSGYCFEIVDAPVSQCRVLQVPGQYATIQAAIDAANECDTVLVAPGTYTENISFSGKLIVVRSSGGLGVTTIRAADPQQAVVRLTNHEPKGATLTGFTITGSSYGGVYCLGSSPTIVNNFITGNRSEHPNTGAGISLKNTTGSLVRGNTFAYDTAGGFGPGIHVGDDGQTSHRDTICFNVFYDNSGVSVIRVLGAADSLRVFNNTIASATNFGIGLNCTGTVDIRNNIITGVAVGYAVGEGWFTSSTVCAYNCLFDNAGNFNDVTVGPGNVLLDPQFVDRANHDYRLQASSPCIDAGDPAAQYNDPDGSRNDIGAFPSTGPIQQCRVIHVPGEFATIHGAVAAASECDTVLVHPGTYYVPQLIIDKRIVVRSSDGPIATTITTDPSTDMIIFRGAAADGAVLEGFTIDGGHAGIWCQNAAPIIRRNILKNQSIDNWAALVLSGSTYGSSGTSPAVIVNNTIVHAANGGISTFSTIPPTIKNNIIAFNDHYGIHNQNYSQPMMSFNDIYGNPDCCFNVNLGTGALAVDPMLADDFTLLAGSPCIDAGDPSPIYNDPDGSRNDMGAIPSAGALPDLINVVQWKKAEGGNDHWYGVIPRSLYWVEADVLAKRPLPDALGLGYLATITSADENAFVLNSVVAGTNQTSILDQFWLGGRDINGVWTWITGEPFVYTNWGTGEPNNVGIETALGMWGPHAVQPGKFNNSLPDNAVNPLHRYWSLVEWNSVSDTVPPDVIPTNEWVLIYCAVPKLDRGFVPPGSIITAYDPSGVLCGATKTNPDGSCGLMPIYRDDPYTAVDEGCQPGDLINFKINDVPVNSQSPVHWTRNGDRFEVCQFLTQKCQDIRLHTGWNLISWNVALATDIETLIAPIRNQVDLVLGFDRGALAYDPDLVPFSTLHQVDYAHGYWFKMNSDATLHLCGGYIEQFNNVIPIYPGWNLVGYWPDATWTVQSALMTVMHNLQVAIGYDMGAQLYVPGQDMYNTLTHLKPGFGYWIRSAANDGLEYFFLPAAEGGRDRSYANAAGNEMASRDWMSLYGKEITLDGRPLVENASIEVFTGEGVKIGQSTYSGGLLKFMPVYGFDANDPNASRYPKDGDLVSVFVNGVKTEPSVEWHGSGATRQLSTLSTAVQVPSRYALEQNFPNPFNPQTTISFELPKSGMAKLTIYNMLGQKIRTLTDQRFDAGQHQIEWDGRSDDGDAVASGIYLYRLEADSFAASRKMILLK